jgi:hypothetical protein
MNYIHAFGFLLDTIGKVMVAYTSIMVHHRFRHEHRVDEALFKMMKWEQLYGVIGILLIILGSSIEMWVILVR